MALSQNQLNTIIDTMSDTQMREALLYLAGHKPVWTEGAIKYAIVAHPLSLDMVQAEQLDQP